MAAAILPACVSLNMKCGIYRIRCTENGRFYIGSSKEIPRRWRNHRLALVKGVRVNNPKLKAAWDKYGEQSFIFEVIFVCAEMDLYSFEQTFIDDLEAVNLGFNVAKCVYAPSRGRKMSPETRAKQRLAKMGKPLSQEHRKKISDAHKILLQDPDRRAEHSLRNIGHKHSAESREKMRAAALNEYALNGRRPTSAETRRKLSLAGKGLKRSPETRARISAGRMGMVFSEETLARMRIAAKRRCEVRSLKLGIKT